MWVVLLCHDGYAMDREMLPPAFLYPQQTQQSGFLCVCSRRKNPHQGAGRTGTQSRFIFSTLSAKREKSTLQSLVSALVSLVLPFLLLLPSPGVVQVVPFLQSMEAF